MRSHTHGALVRCLLGRLAILVIAVALATLVVSCSLAAAARGPTVYGALQSLQRGGALSAEAYGEDSSTYTAALSAVKHLSGARRTELESVIANVQQIAAAGELHPLAAAGADADARKQHPVVEPPTAARRRPAREPCRAATWCGSTTPGRASRSSGWRPSARPTATTTTGTRTRSCAKCSKKRSRSPPSAQAASPGSTSSTSTAARRRGPAGSRRAPRCRRSPARTSRLKEPAFLTAAKQALGIFQTPPPAGVRVATAGRHALRGVHLRPHRPHPQRLHPGAQRALRLRQAHRRSARPRSSSKRATPRRARSGPPLRHRRLVEVRPVHRIEPQLPRAAHRIPAEPLPAHRARRSPAPPASTPAAPHRPPHQAPTTPPASTSTEGATAAAATAAARPGRRHGIGRDGQPAAHADPRRRDLLHAPPSASPPTCTPRRRSRC